MYVVRFAYDVLPVDRDRAIALIRREVEAARRRGLTARLLVPLTRGRGEPALEYEVELPTLDQLDQYRSDPLGSADATQAWMREFSEVLVQPPGVEVFRIDTGTP